MSSGLYVPADTDSSVVEQRIVEAVAGCGETAAATGWASLTWRGARWFRGLGPDGRQRLDVPVALGDRRTIRPRPGVVASDDWLFDDDVTVVDGLPITVAERSVSYEVRRAPSLVRAVQIIDMAAADDLVDIASMTLHASRLAARPGIKRLRTALIWADENVWSPQEVPMRMLWKRAIAGARLLCNAPIFDNAGKHLITPDLFDPVAQVAGEYDGVVHLEDRVRRRDLDRDELYRQLGIEVVTMMSGDSRDQERFLARLHGAHRRAAERRGRAVDWTLERPSRWVDTSTVARRRALDDVERAIWLRYREVS
ncbi:hypothetical protein GCM10009795_037840 [Nocardioides hankookensis]